MWTLHTVVLLMWLSSWPSYEQKLVSLVVGSLVLLILFLLRRTTNLKLKLSQSQVEIQQTEKRLTQFLEAMPFGISVVDHHGEIYYRNRRASQLLSRTSKDNPPTDFPVYKAGNDQIYPSQEEPTGRALRGESVNIDDLEIEFYRQRIPLEVWANPVFDEQGHIIYALSVIQDITERRRAEAELQQYRLELEKMVAERTQALENLNEQLQQDIQKRQDIEQAIRQQNKFLNTIIEALSNPFYVINIEDYSIEIANSAAQALGISQMGTCHALTHHLDAPCDAYGHACPLTTIRQTKKPTVVEHIHYDKAGNPLHVEVHGYPIFNDAGEVIQMIEYSVDITVRKRTEDALRKLSRAVEQSASTIVITDLQGTIEFVNPAFTKITGYSYQEAIGQNPRVLKSGEMSPELYQELWSTITQGKIWEGEMLNRRKSGELFWEHATISPVKDEKGKTTHYVAVKDDITPKKRAEEELQEAHAALEARVDELSVLNLIMQTVSTITDLQTALEVVAQTMMQLFKAHGTIIGLLNESRTTQTITAHHHINPHFSSLVGLEIPVVIDQITQQIINEGQSLIIPHAQTNPLTNHIRQIVQQRNIHCFMCVPLRTRGEIIGVIAISTNQAEQDFTPTDISLAETIAGQIAGAIEIARLFDQEHQQRQIAETLYSRLQDELHLAQEIQYGLLPPPRPNWSDIEVICYTVPASEVGGDFYDYHAFLASQLADTEPQRYALAVGDVSGKGVSAALLMATSLAQLDASLARDFTPTERLTYLDKALEPYTKPRRQNCAMCYVELELIALATRSDEPSVGQLHIINAGCIPPYIKRVTGSIINPEIGGFALGQGLGTMRPYQPYSLELFAGDVIILTSDGVVEANNKTGDMLGFDRLKQIVSRGPTQSASAMLEHLKQELFAFIDQAELHDDMTILVVKI